MILELTELPETILVSSTGMGVRYHSYRRAPMRKAANRRDGNAFGEWLDRRRRVANSPGARIGCSRAKGAGFHLHGETTFWHGRHPRNSGDVSAGRRDARTPGPCARR